MSTTLSIEEGNKLIAEFMGLKPYEDSRYGILYTDPTSKNHGSAFGHVGLKYHTSWDWLKPVIDEIFTYSLAHPDAVKRVSEMKIVVDLIPAWERVVQFIQWLNEHKSLTDKTKRE